MRSNIARLFPLAKPRVRGNSSFVMISALDRLAFDTTQAARIGWFFGLKLLGARARRPVLVPEAEHARSIPARPRLLPDLRSLIEQGWRNTEAGYYAQK